MSTNTSFNSMNNQYKDAAPCLEQNLHSPEALYPLVNKVNIAGIEKCLSKRAMLRLKGDHRGEKIHNVQGVIWITQFGDSKDIILWPDETFEITKNGGLLIQAMTDTSIKITRAHSGPRLGHLFGDAVHQVTDLLGHEQ